MSNEALHGALAENRNLHAEIDRLRAEASRLRRAATPSNHAPTLAAQVLEGIPDLEDVIFDNDGEDLTITLYGVTLNEDNYIVARERDFEVSFEVTIQGEFMVKARNEDEAEDIASEVMADYVDELHDAEADIRGPASAFFAERPDSRHTIDER